MVIKLEGGSDFDLTILDYPDNEDKKEDKRDKEKTDFDVTVYKIYKSS